MSGPFKGVRVLELTSTVSGPFAGMMLADQGAEVIKVEPPGIGDLARFMGTTKDGMGAMFSTLNRNKKCICLDFKNEEDLYNACKQRSERHICFDDNGGKKVHPSCFNGFKAEPRQSVLLCRTNICKLFRK